MSATTSLSRSGWDRTFLDLSSKLAEPFCSAWHLLCFRLATPLDPKKFENCTTRAREIATRVGIVLGAVMGGVTTYLMPIPTLLTVGAMGLGSRALRAIGFALQRDGFTHVRGTAPEKILAPNQIRLMSWNICGIGGGMSLDHGGVVHWRSRLDGIVNKILDENPDVLVLQEVYDTALAEALIERLKAHYAHFFIHLGPNSLGSVGGCMVLSKGAVHAFSHTSFTNNSWALNRGFASLEIKVAPSTAPCARIIGTHLIHGHTDADKRNRVLQVAQITRYIASQRMTLPTVLAGDLNIERDEPEAGVLAAFQHSYKGQEPTCTNQLVAQWEGKPSAKPSEWIDYILIYPHRDARLEKCRLVEAFDETYNTQTALSDHQALAAELNVNVQASCYS